MGSGTESQPNMSCYDVSNDVTGPMTLIWSRRFQYCPIGISPVGKSGRFPRGKPAATESRYPTYGACSVFECFHNPPNSDMDYRILNVHTGVNACDCTRVCPDTRKRVCTES